MIKYNSALLISILAVVLISGCIGQSSEATGGTKGVVIKSFGPVISEIYSGDSVTFEANVENIGEEDATNIKLKLFGLGTDWTGDDWAISASRIKSDIGSLERSQSEDGIQGGVGYEQWDVTSPPDLKVDNTYKASVRLYYSYKTTALANVKVYSNEYLKSNPEDAESTMTASGIDTFTVTDAPITIELAGLSRPLVYRESGQESSMTVLISNIGDGKPYQNSNNEDKPYVTIESMTVHGDDCLDNIEGQYRLPRSGKKSVSCRFRLPEVDSYTTIPVEIELSYNYFVDSTSSIKVLKSFDIGGATTTTRITDTSTWTEVLYENCNSITEWTKGDAWEVESRKCHASNCDNEDRLTSAKISGLKNMEEAELTFDWEYILDDDEYVKVYANDGSGWDMIWSRTSSSSNEEKDGTASIDLVNKGIDLNENVRIRFECGGTGTGDHIYIDDIKIVAKSGGSEGL